MGCERDVALAAFLSHFIGAATSRGCPLWSARTPRAVIFTAVDSLRNYLAEKQNRDVAGADEGGGGAAEDELADAGVAVGTHD